MPPILVALILSQIPRRENVIGPAGVRCPFLAQSPSVGAEGPTCVSWEDPEKGESWHHGSISNV